MMLSHHAHCSCQTWTMLNAPSDVAGIGDENDADLDGLRELVRRAFDLAHESGRREWNVMTTAVLKNRLLQITAREFDEHAYGANSMVELVKKIPDSLTLDESLRPPRATFIGTAFNTIGSKRLEGKAIRPDLWRAIFDYSSPGVYVWNGSEAVLRSADEVTSTEMVLPTITAEDLSDWRAEFSASHPGRDLDIWKDRSSSTHKLPPDLRSAWNGFMKSRALEALGDWFSEHSIAAPPDIMAQLERPATVRSEISELEELRRFLTRCVAVMRPQELRSLHIPATVAARVARR